MTIELSSVLTVLTILGIVAGAIMWVLGRALTDKTDKMKLSYEIKALETRITELEEHADKIEPMQREIDVIKGKMSIK